MTKIVFYLLDHGSENDCQRFACRLVDKIHAQGQRIHIHTDGAGSSRQIDELLWSFRDRSFIPHMIEPQDDGQHPVTIGHGWTPARCEVLINLAPRAPDFLSRFERVAEIVGNEAENRAAGRERYRLYRNRGYTLEHHTIE